MTTHAKASLLGFATLLALASCGDPDGTPDAGGPVVAPEDLPPAQQEEAIVGCLDRIWGAESDAEKLFDRENDQIGGVSISCSMSITATQLAEGLAAIRKAAESGDFAQVLSNIGIPLLYIDENGEAVELQTEEEVREAFGRVFREDILASLIAIDLDNLTIVPDQGVFLDVGSIWLVIPEGTTTPRIVTINHQARNELTDAEEREAAQQAAEAVE